MKFIPALFSLSLLLPLLNACGVQESTSEVKTPPSQVYKFNADGSAGAVKAWNLGASLSCFPKFDSLPPLCNVPVANGSTITWSGFAGVHYAPPMIYGPFLQFKPGPSGVGHLSAEFDLEALGSGSEPGTLGYMQVVGELNMVLDIVSAAGTKVHATRPITLSFGEGRKTFAVNMDPFRESIADLEIRIRDVRVPIPGFLQMAPMLKVHETRIIFN